MRAAAVHLGTTDLRPIEAPLRRLVGEIRSRSIGRPDEERIAALHDVLLPLVTREARPALLAILGEPGRARKTAASKFEAPAQPSSPVPEPAANIVDPAPVLEPEPVADPELVVEAELELEPELERAATAGVATEPTRNDAPARAAVRPHAVRRVLIAAVVGGALVAGGALTVSLLGRDPAVESGDPVQLATSSVAGGATQGAAEIAPQPAGQSTAVTTGQAAEPDRSPPTTTGVAVTAATAPARPYASPLADARRFASRGSPARAIDLLSADALPSDAPEAFSWDSLLAHTALEAAVRRSPDDERNRLFRLVVDRASRALEAVSPFAAGTEQVRLTRAEACIAFAALECNRLEVTEDLLFAARSRDARVGARASALLAEHSR
jgi:hypothetical protein